MSMNGEQYEAILKALADKLNEKDRQISLKDYKIEHLEKKLAEAGKHIEPTEANAIKLEIR